MIIRPHGKNYRIVWKCDNSILARAKRLETSSGNFPNYQVNKFDDR